MERDKRRLPRRTPPPPPPELLIEADYPPLLDIASELSDVIKAQGLVGEVNAEAIDVRLPVSDSLLVSVAGVARPERVRMQYRKHRLDVQVQEIRVLDESTAICVLRFLLTDSAGLDAFLSAMGVEERSRAHRREKRILDAECVARARELARDDAAFSITYTNLLADEALDDDGCLDLVLKLLEHHLAPDDDDCDAFLLSCRDIERSRREGVGWSRAMRVARLLPLGAVQRGVQAARSGAAVDLEDLRADLRAAEQGGAELSIHLSNRTDALFVAPADDVDKVLETSDPSFGDRHELQSLLYSLGIPVELGPGDEWVLISYRVSDVPTTRKPHATSAGRGAHFISTPEQVPVGFTRNLQGGERLLELVHSPCTLEVGGCVGQLRYWPAEGSA